MASKACSARPECSWWSMFKAFGKVPLYVDDCKASMRLLSVQSCRLMICLPLQHLDCFFMFDRRKRDKDRVHDRHNVISRCKRCRNLFYAGGEVGGS
ncbi:hypothetical protein EVAR_64411_1 [Eumeta japonica]|uniref:Uncharacterized protein n=1 Tax=Eumeta variegata TaxID=151549 RepID=A0A4C1ZYZ4_EUMVA|nr:hypothetical protein EVAR_64411_1 [Eumeta japonica]